MVNEFMLMEDALEELGTLTADEYRNMSGYGQDMICNKLINAFDSIIALMGERGSPAWFHSDDRKTDLEIMYDVINGLIADVGLRCGAYKALLAEIRAKLKTEESMYRINDLATKGQALEMRLEGMAKRGSALSQLAMGCDAMMRGMRQEDVDRSPAHAQTQTPLDDYIEVVPPTNGRKEDGDEDSA